MKRIIFLLDGFLNLNIFSVNFAPIFLKSENMYSVRITCVYSCIYVVSHGLGIVSL